MPKINFSFLSISKTLFIFFFTLTVITGCSRPTPMPYVTPPPVYTLTPVPVSSPDLIPQNSVVRLPDWSIIILKPNTKIEILEQPGIPSESMNITVRLLQGEIMAIPNLGGENWFMVQNPQGRTARIQGCAMVVKNDDTSDTFEMLCIGGRCEFGVSPEELHFATMGYSWTLMGGVIQDPASIDYNKLHNEYNGDLPACVSDAESQPLPQIVTETPTPTLDFPATATAACSTFQQLFPSTPCP